MSILPRASWALVILMTVVLAGCGAKSINQVLADPANARNTGVTVKGTVAEARPSWWGPIASRMGARGFGW
jgi:hypothetical protein